MAMARKIVRSGDECMECVKHDCVNPYNQNV